MILKATWPRIRTAVMHGIKRYVVDARPIGKREYCLTKSDAERRAHILRIEAHNQNGVEVTGNEQADAQEALNLIRSTGYTLTDAARVLLKSLEKSTDKKIKVCAEEYLKAKKTQFDTMRIRKRTYSELDSRINMFIDHFGMRPMEGVTHVHLQTWLDQLEVSDRTRQNNLTKVSQFYTWAMKRDYIDKNPCVRVEISSGKVKEEVSILTVEECKDLLKTVKESPHRKAVEAYVYLGLFCGLRPGEAEAFKWEDFNNGQVFIKGQTSKIKEDRFVHPEPDPCKILSEIKGRGVVTGVNFRKKWDSVKKKAGWMTGSNPWPDDVLRHTFASYWLPIYQDRIKLSEEMGNSPEIIKRHYRRAIPKLQAEAFWGLLNQ